MCDMRCSPFLLKPQCTMPGHYVHCIMAPAMDVGGRLFPGLHNQADYASVGTCLLISTPAHELSQYELFHSHMEYGMGPFGEHWSRLGTAFSYIGCVEQVVSIPHMGELVGPIHMEGYAFKSDAEFCDFYVRASTNRPACRYAHYKLAIRNPDEFWRARGATFVARVDMPEWAHQPMARI